MKDNGYFINLNDFIYISVSQKKYITTSYCNESARELNAQTVENPFVWVVMLLVPWAGVWEAASKKQWGCWCQKTTLEAHLVQFVKLACLWFSNSFSWKISGEQGRGGGAS